MDPESLQNVSTDHRRKSMANIQIPAEIIEQPKNYIESGAYLERFKIAHDPLEMPHVPKPIDPLPPPSDTSVPSRPKVISISKSKKRKNFSLKVRRALHKSRVKRFLENIKPPETRLQIWLEGHGSFGKLMWKLLEKLKFFFCYFGLTSINRIPIRRKINSRHLELEPLCCLSSCLVRCGCMSVLVFEVVYVVITTIVITVKLKVVGGRTKLWEPFEPNFNDLITHQLFLYIVLGFNLLTIFAILVLLRGLISFERKYIKFHYRYDFFALSFNTIAFIVYLLALSSEGPETFTFDNVVLLLCFFGQIPLQLWAISVVKSCYDFFNMLNVFITLAETQIK